MAGVDAVLMCRDHQFVIEVTLKTGTVDCHRSPGHRAKDCAECEKAVNEAFALVDWPVTHGKAAS